MKSTGKGGEKMYCRYCMAKIADGLAVCPVCKKSQTAETPAHHLIPGTVLNGKYVVGAALGEGGFGITYIGKNRLLNMKVAIKEYFPSGLVARVGSFSSDVTKSSSEQQKTMYEKGKRRFVDEAQTLGQLTEDEGVVSVYDFFEENGTAYIVMEYLEG